MDTARLVDNPGTLEVDPEICVAALLASLLLLHIQSSRVSSTLRYVLDSWSRVCRPDSQQEPYASEPPTLVQPASTSRLLELSNWFTKLRSAVLPLRPLVYAASVLACLWQVSEGKVSV